MWYFGIPRPPPANGSLSLPGVDYCGQRPGTEPAMSHIRNTVFKLRSAKEIKKEISLAFLARKMSENMLKSSRLSPLPADTHSKRQVLRYYKNWIYHRFEPPGGLAIRMLKPWQRLTM